MCFRLRGNRWTIPNTILTALRYRSTFAVYVREERNRDCIDYRANLLEKKLCNEALTILMRIQRERKRERERERERENVC